MTEGKKIRISLRYILLFDAILSLIYIWMGYLTGISKNISSLEFSVFTFTFIVIGFIPWVFIKD